MINATAIAAEVARVSVRHIVVEFTRSALGATWTVSPLIRTWTDS